MNTKFQKPEKLKLLKKTCARMKCQKEFETFDPKRKFCTDRCRTYDWRERMGRSPTT